MTTTHGGRRRGRGGAGRSGFTLPELLTVIVVLGICAAVAAPAFRPPGRSAAAAAEALRSVFLDARGAAAREGTTVTVELRTATGEFAVVAERAGGIADTLNVGVLPVPPEGVVRGGEGGVARAAFDPLGRARADRVSITEREVRHEVTVDAWTGAARTGP